VSARIKLGTVEPPIGVVGLGNWGTAIAQHLAAQGHEVIAWSANSFIVESIKTVHTNPSYLTGIQLNDRIIPTTSFDEVRRCRCIVLAIPSRGLTDILEKFEGVNGRTVIVSAIKGLDPETGFTPLHLLETSYSGLHFLATISGPCFAADLVRSKPSAMVAASRDKEVAEFVANLFSSSTLRVYTSSDPIGVEIGGIAKNIIAVAAGVSDALELGDSARAAVITRGLAEITRLATTLGAEDKTLSGLSGLGDLLMTAGSDKSRNRRLGRYLGSGMSLSEAVVKLESIAEVVDVCPLVEKLAEELGLEMPITREVGKLLRGEVHPEEMIDSLLKRRLTSEF
jgi:glycerol-3-phosphate dehydrogenase (NAD(P)+)